MEESYQWRIKEWFSDLSEDILVGLQKFHFELIQFNKKMNLISASTEKIADQVHFADCILGSQVILERTKAPEIYDIGSGNGLPGLVLALLAQERRVVLVDKSGKKIEFLKVCASRIGLKNIEVKQTLFED